MGIKIGNFFAPNMENLLKSFKTTPTMHTTEEIIAICKERNELEFLFSITKQIAESDSIGEEYSYCSNYTKEMFNNAEIYIQPEEYSLRGMKNCYCQYLERAGVPIYKLYLNQIGILK